jgi:hypothetical protein
VEGKTFAYDGFDVVGLDHLTWLVLNPDLGTIKVSDYEINASQSLQ